MILDGIVSMTRERLEQRKKLRPPEQVEGMARALCAVPPSLPVLPSLPLPDAIGKPCPNGRFEEAIAGPGISFICELKRASPLKGLMAHDFPYLKIAKEYEDAGAAAISVITEPDFFMGRDDYLREIAEKVNLPVLRKDFVIDAYQIYESKLLGASAVLLLCALLDKKTLSPFIKLAHGLGMAAIVGARNERELDTVLEAGAHIVGVNHRDPVTLVVDIGLSLRLRPLVPGDLFFVAESGIKTADDVKSLADCGVDAVLISEVLMRGPDKKSCMDRLLGSDCTVNTRKRTHLVS
ncbi:MAG: indole-3-glycerol phosphate synthase TrpC [Spirochaetaceae bacterium]|jgi:indole-3-glycerol phosphate synthase|nr:indole-3-glycerol phosphate synthase TrpC [Spirochaetaceae bacterium]